MGFLSENPCGQQLLIAFNFIHWSSPGSRKPSASVASLPTKILTTFEDFMKGNSMKFPEVSQQNIQTHPNYLNYSVTIPNSRAFPPRTKNRTQSASCRDTISGQGSNSRAAAVRWWDTLSPKGSKLLGGPWMKPLGSWKWAMPPPRMAILIGKMILTRVFIIFIGHMNPYDICIYIYIIYIPYIGCSLDSRTASANWAAVIPKHGFFLLFHMACPQIVFYKWVS